MYLSNSVVKTSMWYSSIMNKRAKTIQIFLPDGDPKGIKVACVTSRVVEMTYIPRARLADAAKRQNLSSVGVYFLVGGEDQLKPEVYIGEAENCLARLSQHNKQKDFWNYALVITSRTGDFTKTHAKYLEWLCHDRAILAKRCVIHNSIIPTKSYVDEQMEAFIFDTFDTVEVLTPTLGLNVFQPHSFEVTKEESDLFYAKSRGGEGRGRYTEEGFIVFAGSKCAPKITQSMQGRVGDRLRQELIKEGLLRNFVFIENYTFSSPSTAAEVVLGRAANGWTSWFNKDEKTLDQVYRQA